MRTLLSMLKAGERDAEEGALLIKAALKHDCVEMRVPPQPVPEGLVRDDRACENRPTCGLVVELSEGIVDPSRHMRERAPVMAKERPECLRHGEDTLAMRQAEKHLVGEMFGDGDPALSTAGWTQTKTLPRKGPEVVMSTLGVGTADTCFLLQI
jgi:hypothetical protein